MLTIRHAQMEALAEALVGRCEDDVVAYVKSDFPDEYARRGEDGVRALAVSGVKRARAYSMTRSVDVLGFVSLAFIVGADDFETKEKYAWMQGILKSRTLDPNAKIGMILARLSGAAR